MSDQNPIKEEASSGQGPKGRFKNWIHHLNLITPLHTLIIGTIGTLIALNGLVPDYHITVDPMSAEITPGGIAKSTITIEEKYPVFFLSYNDPIYLNASGLPPNADAKFAGIPRGANFKSSMNILTRSNVTPGTYEITIRAVGSDGREHIGKYFLTIDKPKR